jgi:hypothetical protein
MGGKNGGRLVQSAEQWAQSFHRDFADCPVMGPPFVESLFYIGDLSMNCRAQS